MTNAQVTQLPMRSKAREEIAASVRAHLAVLQISDSELARRIGMSQTQITRRTNGRLPFTSDELGAIAEDLGLTVVDLIQMPKVATVGGGTALVGVTPIRRGWKTVGPERLELPASSVKSGELVQGPWEKRA